jgi:lipopolysaccharide/colanic/teichoic acid biosynthesis glycosyltransferase/GT2 family glycosyltransferase
MISVIVPVYNGEDTLGACLAALRAQSLAPDRYEIIVVDDGSTDRTVDVAREYGVRTICQAHAGPAAARNRGARAAGGDILLFTDADCWPAPDWVERMAEPLNDGDVVGAKGVYRTRQKGLVARFVQCEYEFKYARLARHRYIDFVDTYSAAYRRDLFLANGGFDETFTTASVEDQELSFRLARKGYRLAFAPQAIVFHRHDRTLGEYWRRKFGIGYWKALLLRWHPERAVQDAHTPQALKIEIGLVGLSCLLLPLVPFWAPARWALAVVAALYALATAPFLIWTLGRDPAAAAVAPLLLLLRSLALGSGLAAGALRFSLPPLRRRAPGNRRAPIRGLDRLLKRTMDIVGSAIGLVLSAPLVAVLAVAIKLDSAGPVFYLQERIGERGRPFRMAKLRTMVDGAEDMLPGLIEPASLPAPAFKLRDDPRVTRVGRFLRRASLDELPQLWNVLKGEMSLVGPRPEETQWVRLYADWHRRRLAVRPGITGPMQIDGRADLGLDERVQLELDYIEHYSLWRDVCILARTVGAVVSGRGAY